MAPPIARLSRFYVVILVMLSMRLANAQFTFIYTLDHAILQKYTGFETDVVIPAVSEGLPVTELRDAFWFKTQVTSITIPNSVTNIGAGAFGYCPALAQITLPPNVLTIGNEAFAGDIQLTSITLPASVLEISSSAFNECASLTEITVAPGNPAFASIDGVLFDANINTVIRFPPGKHAAFYQVPASVTCLSSNSFYRANVDHVGLPDGLLTIGDYAFWASQALAGIEIPDSVTSIGIRSFENAGIQNATLGAGIKNIPNGAFVFSSLTNVVFGSGVTNLDGSAFGGCRYLTSVALPIRVKRLGGYAFANCEMLTNIALPEGLLEIGEEAFRASGLTAVAIPNSLTNLARSVFRDCIRLTNFTLGNQVASIPDFAFSGCDSLAPLELPNTVTNIGMFAFENCNSLTNVVIPSSVRTIQDDAFYNSWQLERVTISSNLTSIGVGAFYGCTKMISALFEGNAPTNMDYLRLDPHIVTIYYLPGTTGWPAAYGLNPTALWNASIAKDQNLSIAGARFSFNIVGTSNIQAIVESSTNVADASSWIRAGFVTLTNASAHFVDTTPNDPAVPRLYRLRTP